MNCLDLFAVIFRPALTILGVLDEEGVVCVSGRVTLWLEQSIEIPERALDEPIGRHFTETHTEEDFLELLSDQ